MSIDWDKLDSAGRLGAAVPWWRRDAEQIFRAMLSPALVKVPSDDDLRLFARLYSSALELVSERAKEHIVVAVLYRFRGCPVLIVPSVGTPMVETNGMSSRDGTTPAHVIHVLITSANEESIRGFANTRLADAGLPSTQPRLAVPDMQDAVARDRHWEEDAFCVGWRLKLKRPR